MKQSSLAAFLGNPKRAPGPAAARTATPKTDTDLASKTAVHSSPAKRARKVGFKLDLQSGSPFHGTAALKVQGLRISL